MTVFLKLIRLRDETVKLSTKTPCGSCLQAAVIGYVKEKDEVAFVKKESPAGDL